MGESDVRSSFVGNDWMFSAVERVGVLTFSPLGWGAGPELGGKTMSPPHLVVVGPENCLEHQTLGLRPPGCNSHSGHLRGQDFVAQLALLSEP